MEPLTTSVKMLVVQSCLTLGDPMDSNPLGCSVHGILQARILEAIPFSRHLPNPGIECGSLALQADPLPSEPPGKPVTIRPPGDSLTYSVFIQYVHCTILH